MSWAKSCLDLVLPSQNTIFCEWYGQLSSECALSFVLSAVFEWHHINDQFFGLISICNLLPNSSLIGGQLIDYSRGFMMVCLYRVWLTSPCLIHKWLLMLSRLILYNSDLRFWPDILSCTESAKTIPYFTAKLSPICLKGGSLCQWPQKWIVILCSLHYFLCHQHVLGQTGFLNNLCYDMEKSMPKTWIFVELSRSPLFVECFQHHVQSTHKCVSNWDSKFVTTQRAFG